MPIVFWEDIRNRWSGQPGTSRGSLGPNTHDYDARSVKPGL